MTTTSVNNLPPQPAPPVFVGIDVAKAALDLARSDSRQILHVPNTPEGFQAILNLLKPLKVARIVIEATGGLEQPLLDALLDAQLPVARVNPANVRHFAQGLGQLAKTDALDACILVEFAARANTRLAEKRSKNQVELDALVTCRRQLVATRTQHTNRLGASSSKSARKAIASVLQTLEKQIKSLDRQIASLIDSDEGFKEIDQLLRSVPGVGPGLSTSLIAELQEIGDADRRQLCALVGVAPMNKDSGTFKGKRSIRGGRAALRSILYIATVAAIRCNPLIKAFALRLQAQMKPGKVVVVACMRKLLSMLNAMIKYRLSWNQLNVVKHAQTT
jgi:transposase